MNTKLRQRVRKPSKKEIGGAFVTLVLAGLVAMQGGYNLDNSPDMNQSNPVDNTDNATVPNSTDDPASQNQSLPNSTQNMTSNLSQPEPGNTTNTS